MSSKSVVLGVFACILVFAAGRWSGAGQSATREVPKFQFKLLDGTPFRSNDLAGRITVIDFWGTWCRPCIAEIPGYNAFYKDYRAKGVLFVAIAVESGKESEVRAAVQRLGMEYPVAAPSSEQLDPFNDVTVFPTTWIVNDGRIEKEFTGAPAEKHKVLRETIDRLLTGK